MENSRKKDMMTSEKQITANKKNALKSTGPKTDEGKQKSCANSLKHGLTSDSLMHAGVDNIEEFQKYTRSMTEYLNPQNDLERFFVNRIVSCTWRLKRVVLIEEHIFNRDCQVNHDSDPADFLFNYIRDKMVVIGRYETSIERSLFKTLGELKKLRAD